MKQNKNLWLVKSKIIFKNYFLTLVLILPFGKIFSQSEKIYLNENEKISPKNKAMYYEIVQRIESKKDSVEVKIFYLNDKLFSHRSGFYEDKEELEFSGHIKNYFENGKISSEGNVVQNEKKGWWKFYLPKGTLYETKEFNADSSDINTIIFWRNGTKYFEGKIINNKKNGVCKFYNSDGKLYSEQEFLDGKLNGLYKIYFENGNLFFSTTYSLDKRLGKYKQWNEAGKLVAEYNYLNDSTTDEKPVEKDTSRSFKLDEHLPEFVGGEEKMMQFLSDKIKYPAHDRDNMIQGKVRTQFTVSDDGKLIDIIVYSSPSYYMTQEVYDVLDKMPNWKPGTQNGKAVKVLFTLPIEFSLQ
jgi:TonB family protein